MRSGPGGHGCARPGGVGRRARGAPRGHDGSPQDVLPAGQGETGSGAAELALIQATGASRRAASREPVTPALLQRPASARPPA